MTINKEHLEKVKEARAKTTVLQIRLTVGEKIAFELEAGKGNTSETIRMLMNKYVKGEIV
jgi:hypothetical protein